MLEARKRRREGVEGLLSENGDRDVHSPSLDAVPALDSGFEPSPDVDGTARGWKAS